MSWRTPTENDLVATLSREEIDAFRRDGGDLGSDPVAEILARTVEMVRGVCRQNRTCVLDPDETTIPGSLMSRAMDYAMYDVLTRFGVAVGEDRRRKYDHAEEWFGKVAKGEITPEPGTTSPGTDSHVAGSISVPEQKL